MTAALAEMALALVVEYEHHSAAARNPRHRLRLCSQARDSDGNPLDPNVPCCSRNGLGCACEYDRPFRASTCYTRSRDDLRDEGLSWVETIESPEREDLTGESEWCDECMENERIWQEHRKAVRARGVIKQRMCALGRRAKALAGCPDGEK